LLSTGPVTRPVALTQNAEPLGWLDGQSALAVAPESTGVYENGGRRVLRRRVVHCAGDRAQHDRGALRVADQQRAARPERGGGDIKMARSKKRGKRGRRRSSAKAGLAPGAVVFIGEQKVDQVRIDIIDYDATRLDEYRGVSVERCRELARAQGVTWINVNGLHDAKLIEELGASFGWHPLTLADLVDTAQRPKAEAFPDYFFVVLKMVEYAQTGMKIEHVSLILGGGYVVSFLEDEGDVFDAVRERLRAAKGRIRALQADYLAYALMDAVVDQYFMAVELIGDHIEDIDDRILTEPRPEDVQEIHRLKRDMLSLRKAVWPLREEIGALEKSDSPLISEGTRLFLRDLYDHTIQVIDMVETFRDIIAGVHDTYLSTISNRMNEIMKMLTIVATVFIPLTFIAGVYGMNFEYMPELKWRLGYYVIWGVMGCIGLGMLAYFKLRRWF